MRLLCEFFQNFQILQPFAEQSVPVAVGVNSAVAAFFKADGDVLLGVQLNELGAVVADPGDEGDIVALGHRVGDGHADFVLDRFHGDGVGVILWLSLLHRQGDAAAGEAPLAYGCNHIAAHRADIKAHTAQVGRAVLVRLQVAGHQLGQRYAQCAGQLFQQADIGQALARFP